MPDNNKLPRVLAGVCEFCGVDATQCSHSKQFDQAGLLKDDARAAKFRKVVEQDYEDMPPVVNGVCTQCGVPCAGTASLTDEQREEYAKLEAERKTHLDEVEAVMADGKLSDEEKEKKAEKLRKAYAESHPSKVMTSAIAPCGHYAERKRRADEIVGGSKRMVDPDAAALHADEVRKAGVKSAVSPAAADGDKTVECPAKPKAEAEEAEDEKEQGGESAESGSEAEKAEGSEGAGDDKASGEQQ